MGNLYLADTVFELVRKIDLSGVITTFAGIASEVRQRTACRQHRRHWTFVLWPLIPQETSISEELSRIKSGRSTHRAFCRWLRAILPGGFSGDGGLAVNAGIRDVYCLATDSFGNLYICDLGNNRIRKVDSQEITTAAGNGNFPVFGERIMNGPATAVAIGQPQAAAADSAGNLYVASNGQISRVDTSGQLTVIAGNLSAAPGDGGDALCAGFSEIVGLTFDTAGDLLVNDAVRIRKLTPVGPADYS